MKRSLSYTALFLLAVAVFSCDAFACPKGTRCGGPATPEVAPVVNVNTATADQLRLLPGVGPKSAAAIIAARPYAQVADMIRAKGIGPAKLAKLRPYVVVKGKTTATSKIRAARVGAK